MARRVRGERGTKSESISVDKFVELIENTGPVEDLEVKPNYRFALEDKVITFGGMVAGPLVMYQARSMFGAVVDITGTSKLLPRMEDETVKSVLLEQVNGLNAAIEARGGDHLGNSLARTFIDDEDRLNIGGLVSRRYAPVSHWDLVQAMTSSDEFRDAQIVKWRVERGRIDAMVVMAGGGWQVDGGLKVGLKLHNGQFGDRAYGFAAMLFRLLCANGMMDVFSSAGATSRRHTGSAIDLVSDVKATSTRASELKLLADHAMGDEIDVEAELIDLHRRKLISRGPLAESLARIDDLGGGGNGQRTRWALAQAIAASARNYSFSQAEDLTRVAGRIVIEGLSSIKATSPVPTSAPSVESVREEFLKVA